MQLLKCMIAGTQITFRRQSNIQECGSEPLQTDLHGRVQQVILTVITPLGALYPIIWAIRKVRGRPARVLAVGAFAVVERPSFVAVAVRAAVAQPFTRKPMPAVFGEAAHKVAGPAVFEGLLEAVSEIYVEGRNLGRQRSRCGNSGGGGGSTASVILCFRGQAARVDGKAHHA